MPYNDVVLWRDSAVFDRLRRLEGTDTYAWQNIFIVMPVIPFSELQQVVLKAVECLAGRRWNSIVDVEVEDSFEILFVEWTHIHHCSLVHDR